MRTFQAFCLLIMVGFGFMGSSGNLQAQPESSKEIKELVKDAEVAVYLLEFRRAIPVLIDALAIQPNHARANYLMGVSFVRIGRQFEAYPYLRRAIQEDPNVADDLFGIYAEVLHYNLELDSAEAYYQRQINSLRRNSEKAYYYGHRLEQVFNARRLIQDSVEVTIENLGLGVNSPYPDYTPAISADESVLAFTSRRPENFGRLAADGLKHEDIYYSRLSLDGTFRKAENIGQPINTPFHDATSSLSADGQTIYIYRDSDRDLRFSRLDSVSWTVPIPMSENINGKKSWEPHGSLSADGKRFYFVSDREGGQGGLDIWFSEKQPDGTWGPALNLGPTVNSPYDERGPFIHPDGITLYFSSNGHNSMGGLDVFKTVRRGTENWSRPSNLGYPINTVGDDVYFVLAANGYHAYYSSVRPSGYGDADIYRIIFPHLKPGQGLAASEYAAPDTATGALGSDNLSDATPISPTAIPAGIPDVDTVSAQPARTVILLKGSVLDAGSGSPMPAQVEVFDLSDRSLIESVSTNTATGNYLVSLPTGGNYAIEVEAPGYLFHSENIDVRPTREFHEVVKEVKMRRMVTGEVAELNNIFFELNSAKLDDASQTELNLVVHLLRENPNLRLKVIGHTDASGDPAYNLQLSKLRAQSVQAYLVEKGISASRLETLGLGQTKPLAPNDTPANRMRNRRTEIEIISVD